jgi:hypothetical protein
MLSDHGSIPFVDDRRGLDILCRGLIVRYLRN